MLSPSVRWAALAIVNLGMGTIAHASETWVFRFSSQTRAISTSWHDDLIFHNPTGQDATVNLVGMSNGGSLPSDQPSILVPAGRTVSLQNLFGVWIPAQDVPLWIVHVEAPDAIVVVSRGGAHGECPSPCGAPPNPFPTLGTFSMPVFQSLVPVGQEQIHIGADLGAEPSRINVGIYNAGASTATATVAVYQACDDTLLESRTVAVPADSAAQFGGLGAAKTQCDVTRGINIWLRYLIVTVDQPSVSYVFNVADDLAGQGLPRIPFAAALGP